MKVWEEEWKTVKNDSVTDLQAVDGMTFAGFLNPERARLAAQAPAMARLLLEAGEPNKDGNCVFCSAWIEENRFRGPPEPHRGSCKLVQVLRDAGVLS